MGMKLLLVHNYYQQRGGEDVVFEAEAGLLESRGHQVLRYVARNEGLENASGWDLARRTVWNGRTHRELTALLNRERPDVIHLHNTLPLISPAAYYAARSAGVPVVQTLHNYRLLCPSATLFRAGAVCEDCLAHSLPLPAIRHGCYRGSRPASAAVAAMLAAHRLVGTWRRTVRLFIALTEFARTKFVEAGLPAERIVVKQNFTRDPGLQRTAGDYALFVGRLSPEKGVTTLLDAWRKLGSRVRLRVIGDGPEAPLVAAAAQSGQAIDFLGHQPSGVVAGAMAGARFLVFPSVWYETFGLAIIEAYAAGLPVLASDLGAMASLVTPGSTGLRFRPGDPDDLARQVAWALDHPDEMRSMGRNARREYEERYTADTNYDGLMQAYAIATRRTDAVTGRAPQSLPPTRESTEPVP
jgi:glycosyltransferase involved in cell wall biosynthesis